MAYKKEVEGGCSSGEITTLGDSQEREESLPRLRGSQTYETEER